MLDAQAIQLMHLHGGQLVPMTEVVDSPARHDEEREWVRGARIFSCRECDEKVVIQPPEPGGQRPGPQR